MREDGARRFGRVCMQHPGAIAVPRAGTLRWMYGATLQDAGCSSMRTLYPLTGMDPALVQQLRQSPDGAMVPVSCREGRLWRVEFVIKASPDAVAWLTDSPRVTSTAGLRYIPGDRDAGEGALSILSIAEAKLQAAPGSASASAPAGARCYLSRCEFPANRRRMLELLQVLITQPHWQYRFVDSAVMAVLHEVRVPNPLTALQQGAWQERVQKWLDALC